MAGLRSKEFADNWLRGSVLGGHLILDSGQGSLNKEHSSNHVDLLQFGLKA
jgi:hypothetical protein